MNILRPLTDENPLFPPLPSGEGRGEGELRVPLVRARASCAPSARIPARNSPLPQPARGQSPIPLASPEGRGGKCLYLLFSLFFLFPCASACAENWPQWRGPRTD